FLIGAIAIAGVPPLAGFFSKDEILFHTFVGGHTLLWSVGLLTSLLTAIYMFRLVFLAFHGPRAEHLAPGTQHPEPGAQHSAPSAQHSAPSTQHPGTPSRSHDAPPAMAVALIVLAIGSVAAGWVGLGGRFAHFLEPSFAPQAVEA